VVSKKKLTSEEPEAMEVRLLAEVPYITVEAVVLGFSALKAPWPLCMNQVRQSICVCHTQRNLMTI